MGSAMEIAGKLPPSHPIRLGLALNFSVFYYEVFGSPDKACALAKSSFDEAVSAASDLGEADYQDSAQILGLLHDNLQLRTADGPSPASSQGACAPALKLSSPLWVDGRE